MEDIKKKAHDDELNKKQTRDWTVSEKVHSSS